MDDLIAGHCTIPCPNLEHASHLPISGVQKVSPILSHLRTITVTTSGPNLVPKFIFYKTLRNETSDNSNKKEL